MKVTKEIFLKIIVIIFLFLFICCSSYVISFFRYDNYNIIEFNVLKHQNNLLKNELREITNFQQTFSYEIGKVIVRDIHNFYNEIVIKVNSDDVNVGDAVVNEEGLVGVVYKKYSDNLYVKLLSSDYNVSVKIGDTYGNLSSGVITLLDKYSDIKEGDLVYTSGLSDIPQNIYVGKIIEVSMDDGNLGKKVKVELVNNDYLNYVGIVSNIK